MNPVRAGGGCHTALRRVVAEGLVRRHPGIIGLPTRAHGRRDGSARVRRFRIARPLRTGAQLKRFRSTPAARHFVGLDGARSRGCRAGESCVCRDWIATPGRRRGAGRRRCRCCAGRTASGRVAVPSVARARGCPGTVEPAAGKRPRCERPREPPARKAPGDRVGCHPPSRRGVARDRGSTRRRSPSKTDGDEGLVDLDPVCAQGRARNRPIFMWMIPAGWTSSTEGRGRSRVDHVARACKRSAAVRSGWSSGGCGRRPLAPQVERTSGTVSRVGRSCARSTAQDARPQLLIFLKASGDEIAEPARSQRRRSGSRFTVGDLAVGDGHRDPRYPIVSITFATASSNLFLAGDDNGSYRS
jgi:hypothetical protein